MPTAAGPGDGALFVNEHAATKSKKAYALWRRVKEITRAVRAEWNPIVNA